MKNENETKLIKLKLGGKSTYVLFLSDKDYNKIKNWFDFDGRLINESIKNIGTAKGYSWNLYLSNHLRQNRHTLWGLSGDYTFGDAPQFYTKKYFGNVRESKEVFEKFLKIIEKIN